MLSLHIYVPDDSLILVNLEVFKILDELVETHHLKCYTVYYDEPHPDVPTLTEHLRVRLWTPGRLFDEEDITIKNQVLQMIKENLKDLEDLKIVEVPCEYMPDRWGGRTGFAIIADIFDWDSRFSRDYFLKLVDIIENSPFAINDDEKNDYLSGAILSAATIDVLALLHGALLSRPQKKILLSHSVSRFQKFTTDDNNVAPLTEGDLNDLSDDIWASYCLDHDLYENYLDLVKDENFKSSLEDLSENMSTIQLLIQSSMVKRSEAFLYPFTLPIDSQENQYLNFVADILHFMLNRRNLTNHEEFFVYLASYAGIDEV
jgi:hypothetical protein